MPTAVLPAKTMLATTEWREGQGRRPAAEGSGKAGAEGLVPPILLASRPGRGAGTWHPAFVAPGPHLILASWPWRALRTQSCPSASEPISGVPRQVIHSLLHSTHFAPAPLGQAPCQALGRSCKRQMGPRLVRTVGVAGLMHMIV